ncbi:stAR-related lipid transfer protein 3 isoform X2 [Procambarus clarkii]|uniref:stAR-related lipid transfer protein 3 isoform X2 n=1 Tax=Procambarus clarkii TaxID=6728 RepID=UPI001E674725|nr:steroidogenic acute regulatory protein-like isoform X2 [Procambarus clarkii]
MVRRLANTFLILKNRRLHVRHNNPHHNYQINNITLLIDEEKNLMVKIYHSLKVAQQRLRKYPSCIGNCTIAEMSRHGNLSTLAWPGSMNSVSSDFWLANHFPGMQINGRMSAVRRFFCLFVTFDFLFTSLFWAICVLINKGEYKALVEEIIHYNIKSSIFDVVMVAASRFIILLLFYALLHINHWWMVAITTAGSCAFFICKSLMYKWNDKTSYPFEVMLILLSFFIAWIEAWFIDFRVLPQEARAKSILEASNTCDQSESDPLLPQLERRVRDYLNNCSDTVGDFYSPLDSPLGSDEEDENCSQLSRKLSPQEIEIQNTGFGALQRAWETIHSSGWKLEKESSHGDNIYSKEGPKGSRIYKLTTLDSNTDVVYQVASEGPGGVVTARDFVSVRHWKKIGDSWVCAAVSVEYDDEPLQKKFVRGDNGPGCFVFHPADEAPKKCHFQWLLDTDLKGWIPQYVIDQTLTYAMTDFMSCLRSYIPTLKAARLQRDGAR